MLSVSMSIKDDGSWEISGYPEPEPISEPKISGYPEPPTLMNMPGF